MVPSDDGTRNDPTFSPIDCGRCLAQRTFSSTSFTLSPPPKDMFSRWTRTTQQYPTTGDLESVQSILRKDVVNRSSVNGRLHMNQTWLGVYQTRPVWRELQTMNSGVRGSSHAILLISSTTIAQGSHSGPPTVMSEACQHGCHAILHALACFVDSVPLTLLH